MLPSAIRDRLVPQQQVLDGEIVGQCYNNVMRYKYSNTVFCTVLYYTILYCTVLYCTVSMYYTW